MNEQRPEKAKACLCYLMLVWRERPRRRRRRRPSLIGGRGDEKTRGPVPIPQRTSLSQAGELHVSTRLVEDSPRQAPSAAWYPGQCCGTAGRVGTPILCFSALESCGGFAAFTRALAHKGSSQVRIAPRSMSVRCVGKSRGHMPAVQLGQATSALHPSVSPFAQVRVVIVPTS